MKQFRKTTDFSSDPGVKMGKQNFGGVNPERKEQPEETFNAQPTVEAEESKFDDSFAPADFKYDIDNPEVIKIHVEKRVSTGTALIIAGSISLFITLVLLIVTLVSSKSGVSIKPQVSSSFPISFANEIDGVVSDGNKVCVINGMNFSMFSSGGKQILEEKTSFLAPCVSISGKYTFVYDRGGNSFTLYENSKLIYSGKSDKGRQIIFGVANKSGDFAVITAPSQSSEYASYLCYYNKDGNLLFSWGSSDYLIKADISPDTKYLAVAGLKADDAKIGTHIKIMNIADCITVADNAEKNIKDGKTEKDMDAIDFDITSSVLECRFVSKTDVLAVCPGKRVVCSISSSDSLCTETEFTGELERYALDQKGNLVTMTAGSDGAHVLTVYDKLGAILFSAEMKKEVTVNDIKISNRNVYVLTSDKLLLYSNSPLDETLEEYKTIKRGISVYGKHIYSYSSNTLNRF